jgi:hypothetical protein
LWREGRVRGSKLLFSSQDESRLIGRVVVVAAWGYFCIFLDKERAKGGPKEEEERRQRTIVFVVSHLGKKAKVGGWVVVHGGVCGMLSAVTDSRTHGHEMRCMHTTVRVRVRSRLNIPKVATVCGSYGSDDKSRGVYLSSFVTFNSKPTHSSSPHFHFACSGSCCCDASVDQIIRFLVFDMTSTLCFSRFLFFLFLSPHGTSGSCYKPCTAVQPVLWVQHDTILMPSLSQINVHFLFCP